MTQPVEKVAVLGGGLGSLITLAGIVSRPEWKNQYEFTVYEKSWRLGGKGASGREPVNPNGSWEDGSRILEHGLHIWLGFYNNAFHYMQAAFEALGEDWANFYTSLDLLVFQESLVKVPDSLKNPIHYEPWPINFPTNPGVPGTPSLFGWEGAEESPEDSAAQLLGALIPFVRKMMSQSGVARQFDELIKNAAESAEGLKKLALLGLDELLKTRLKGGISSWLDSLEEQVKKILEKDAVEAVPFTINLITFLQRWLHTVPLIYNLNKNSGARHIYIALDLGLALLRGIIESEVITKGFDSINDLEWTAWLKQNGASEWTLDSAPIRALYDLVFGYEKGDINQRSFSAGVSLYCIFRIFLTYKGHILWKMNMGMGDTIFTTLEKYLSLKGEVDPIVQTNFPAF